MDRQPPITVIALCFNHERFLSDCLESIRAQSCQNFELIVTDDCSRDGSAAMIAAWLAQHYPAARFIRHTTNKGICATLNEALSVSSGEFISMVATDDCWRPDKLERQLSCMRAQSERVAVVYSDAEQMDENGQRLPKDFMEAHLPGKAPPSGDVFSALANGNFIPAMATLIRRSTLAAMGGYDERLSYEDYDMWLRLAAGNDFAFCEGTLARYRIVSTSIVRTLFQQPNARHLCSQFDIREKWINTGRLSPLQRHAWANVQWEAAYGLYVCGDVRATPRLWRAFRRTGNIRALALALASSLHISRDRAKRWLALMGGKR